MEVHDFNPSTWEEEKGGPLNLRAASSTVNSETARAAQRNLVSERQDKNMYPIDA